jgi:hypothetical protein
VISKNVMMAPKGGFKHPGRYVNGVNDPSARISQNNSRSVSRHEEQRPPMSKHSSKKVVLGASATQHSGFNRNSTKAILLPEESTAKLTTIDTGLNAASHLTHLRASMA